MGSERVCDYLCEETMVEKKDITDRRKDTTGLVYQLIKKVNLLTKRIEELEKRC